MASYHKTILEAADELERQRAEARAQCDEANEEYKLLRDAAAALVAELERTSGDWPKFCDAPMCKNLALVDDGDQAACDEHQGMLVDGDVEDLSYAPALRTLRALLEGT